MKSKHLCEHCPDQTKLYFLGCKDMNDEAESTLGGATHQVHRYERISLAEAGAISDGMQNSFSYHPTSNKDKKSKGMFRSFDKVLRAAIIKVGIKDAPRTRTVNNEAVELQQKSKQAKEDIKREKNMAKASEDYIEAIYYHRMYDSMACWKGSASRVNEGLKKLTSKTAKYDALKENIMI